jgi:cytidylate kinase
MPPVDSPSWCVLISGGIASGKTTVAQGLASTLDARLVRVRQALLDVLGLEKADRRTLQEEGSALDKRTNGRWLLDYLLQHSEFHDRMVVDSLRTQRQAIPVLEGVHSANLVFLDVTRSVREKRFASAAVTDPVKASMGLAQALRHDTEIQVEELRPLAALVIESDDLSAEQTVDEIISSLNLR